MEELNYTGRTIVSSSKKAEYDDAIKQILADKQVLARILKYVTREFQDEEFDDIIKCIEDPSIANVPVYPGLTNDPVTGLPQESKIVGEGVLYYDIRFFVRNPKSDGKNGIRIIVDVEAQKDYYPGYDLVNRAIVYGGRMLSEQVGRNVTGHDYDKVEKVYTIWLCFNCSQKDANTISSYSIVHQKIYGEYEDRKKYDLLQAIMVRIPKEHEMEKAKNKPDILHKFIYDLIVKKELYNEKLKNMRERYGLKTESMEKEVSHMCNLSEALVENTWDEAWDAASKQTSRLLIIDMVHDGVITPEYGAKKLDMSMDEFIQEMGKDGYHMPESSDK